MSDPKKDPMSAHEALDRAFLVSNIFAEFCGGHPFVCATPELCEAAEKLEDQLAAFYQLCGKYALDD